MQAVAAGGPAATAGIRGGDLIVGLNGQQADAFTLGRLLATASVGDDVAVDLLRDGERSSVTVVLREAP